MQISGGHFLNTATHIFENHFVCRSLSSFLIIDCNQSDWVCGECECLWSKQSWLVLPKTHTVPNNCECYPKLQAFPKTQTVPNNYKRYPKL